MPSKKKATNFNGYYQLMTIIFVSSLISANVIAVKIIDIFGFIVPAGIIVFPFCYIVNDVVTEVYGFSATRKIILWGFLANLIFVIFTSLAIHIPPAPFWKNGAAYASILGYTPRLLTASFIAYLIGSFANSFVLSKLKIKTKGKFLWIRTIGSTIVGEGLDSLVFITIAFAGTVGNTAIINMVSAQWLLKILYEVLATPLTYKIVSYIKSREKIDTYDNEDSYHLLPL